MAKYLPGEGVTFGVVPNKVLNDDRLSFKAKGLFAYIQSKPSEWDFNGRRIAKDSKDGYKSVYAGLKELEDAGYLTRKRYKDEKGKFDWEYTLTSASNCDIQKVDIQFVDHEKVDNNKERSSNKESVKKNIPSTNVEEAKPQKEYGNENINWLFKEFETIMQFTPKGTQKQERRYAKHLLDNFTMEQLTYMLTYCSTDKYAPRVGSMEKLWFKRGDIVAGIKSRVQNNTPKTISI